MPNGAWSMNENGEFILNEPYKTHLESAKLLATKGWRDGLYDYLEGKCPYTREQLNEELLRRVRENERTSMEMLESFVIEAIDGDL